MRFETDAEYVNYLIANSNIKSIPFTKTNLNKIIKWTSSKFNEYKKQDVINSIVDNKNNNDVLLKFSSGAHIAKLVGDMNFTISFTLTKIVYI